jgi:hypothetical protein
MKLSEYEPICCSKKMVFEFCLELLLFRPSELTSRQEEMFLNTLRTGTLNI